MVIACKYRIQKVCTISWCKFLTTQQSVSHVYIMYKAIKYYSSFSFCMVYASIRSMLEVALLMASQRTARKGCSSSESFQIHEQSMVALKGDTIMYSLT